MNVMILYHTQVIASSANMTILPRKGEKMTVTQWGRIYEYIVTDVVWHVTGAGNITVKIYVD